MKKLFFLLLFITTPAFACNKEEIQEEIINQRFAATAYTVCLLIEEKVINKDMGKGIIKVLSEEARRIHGEEMLAIARKLMFSEREL